MYSPFDIFIDVLGNGSLNNATYQAVVAKTFDGYVNNGTINEPFYWWPSWYDIYALYQYNISLA